MVVPKITENAVTNIITQYLSKKIPKVFSFLTIETPNGRREVDIYCENGGAYVVEAKYTENELLEAISKIQNDYLKYSKILGINGGFALLYPEELKTMRIEKIKELLPKLKFLLICQFSPEDKRGFAKYEGSLQEIVDFLSQLILQPLKPVEVNVEFVIRTLKKCTQYIVESLRELPEKELKKFFGEQKVFRHILPTKEGEIPVENLREGVAYILLTQLLFYHILSRIRTDLPQIDSDKVNHPKDLDSFFDKLVDKTKDYKAIFSFKIAKALPPKEDIIRKIKELINVINGISPEKIGGDLLGTVFHDLVPFEVRKAVAAYYTNVLAAELLAWLSIDDYNSKVIDLAVGSGGLLVASYRRKKELARNNFDEKLHKNFIENQLYGIDIMPFAAAIAASHLALQMPQFLTQRVNIGVWDSTELEPGMEIPTIATAFKKFLSKTVDQKQLIEFGVGKKKPLESERRVVELSEFTSDIQLSKVNLVIMNPPFTRQERIPEEYKKALEERFKDYKNYIRGQMSYFGYFILLADKFLEDNGKLAFVLPATFLSKKHSEGVREFLADNYFVEYIVLNQERLSFSESTLFREILLVARKTKKHDGKTKIIFLKKFPKSLEESRDIANTIRSVKGEYEDDKLLVKSIDYKILVSNTQNWYKWVIYSPILDFTSQLFTSNKLQLFKPYIKNTKRLDLDKIKVGNFHPFLSYEESRALKKYDLWIVKKINKDKITIRHKILNKEIELPLSILKRGLRRHTNVKKLDVTHIADFLIYKWNEKVKEIAQYMLTSEKLKKINKDLLSSWKKYIESRECNLLILRRPFIFSPGTSCLAFFSKEKIVGINMWNIRLFSDVIENSKILCLWFNSSLSLLQLFGVGISAEGNWTKIDEYMLSQLYVPNLKSLKDGEKKKLLNLFEKVKNKDWDSILEQFKKRDRDREEIDKTFLEILGFSEDQINKILDIVYEIILGELESLSQTVEIKEE